MAAASLRAFDKAAALSCCTHLRCWPSSRRMAWAIGTIMAVVAVLLSHIDRNAVTFMKPNIILEQSRNEFSWNLHWARVRKIFCRTAHIGLIYKSLSRVSVNFCSETKVIWFLTNMQKQQRNMDTEIKGFFSFFQGIFDKPYFSIKNCNFCFEKTGQPWKRINEGFFKITKVVSSQPAWESEERFSYEDSIFRRQLQSSILRRTTCSHPDWDQTLLLIINDQLITRWIH